MTGITYAILVVYAYASYTALFVCPHAYVDKCVIWDYFRFSYKKIPDIFLSNMALDMHTCTIYKVVQIWPGQTVTCLHTNSPGHIWTTLYLTFCDEQIICQVTKKFREILFHYPGHKSPPPHIEPLESITHPPSYLFKADFNIILSVPGSSKRSPFLRILYQNFVWKRLGLRPIAH